MTATTTAEKIAIMQAYLDGKTIETLAIGSDTWYGMTPITEDVGEPLWDWKQFKYRIKPEPEPVAMDIPWHMIKPAYKWAAMDSNGKVYVSIKEPTLTAHSWYSSDYITINALNFDRGNKPWDQSLVQRPE